MAKKTIIAAATMLSIVVITPLAATAHAGQDQTMGQNGQAGMKNMQGSGMSAGMGPGAMMNKHGKGGKGQMKMMGRMMKMRKMMMGKMFMVRKKPYSNADIKRLIDGRLAKHGFSSLMAGDVVDGSDQMPGSAIVNVVSPKGEMLFKVEVNRKNGMAAIIE